MTTNEVFEKNWQEIFIYVIPDTNVVKVKFVSADNEEEIRLFDLTDDETPLGIAKDLATVCNCNVTVEFPAWCTPSKVKFTTKENK